MSPNVVTPLNDKFTPFNDKSSQNILITPEVNSFSEKLLSAAKYKSRTNSGQIVASHNHEQGFRGEFEPSSAKPIGLTCRIQCQTEDFENIKDRYRYMYTTLEERMRALDRHLLKLQNDMCEMANIPKENLQRVGIPSPEVVWVCGRICCETNEGKINKSSVVLEGSRKESGGNRVLLDLKELPSYSLFPGQIVLVEGINSSGRKMIARTIIDGISCQKVSSHPSKLLEYHQSNLFQNGHALSVVVASGPFTTSNNLEYEPLQDLLIHVLKKKPDVLILTGPFVDISQPLLASGDVLLKNLVEDETDEKMKLDGDDDIKNYHQASYEMVFVEKIIRDGLRQMFNSEVDFGVVPTNIILIPSLLDAHHEFVFPQPPFGDRDRIKTPFFNEDLGVLDIPFSSDKDSRKRVHLLSNPAMFRFLSFYLFCFYFLKCSVYYKI
jgi:DNA polymerase alpha subunit B